MPHRITNGNNMPVQAPLIPDPFVPYECPDNATLAVLCRTDPDLLARYLEPTPFEPTGDTFVAYASDFLNCDKAKYMDAGIVIPITCDGETGATYLFEYEDDDAAIAAGRDLWGYPKKYGEIAMTVDGDRAEASILRKGTTILSISADFSTETSFEMPPLAPHFNVHTQPGPAGEVLSRRIIRRDTSADFQLKTRKLGTAKVKLASLPTDPLGEFADHEVIGAMLTIGDFYATEQNGWGELVRQL